MSKGTGPPALLSHGNPRHEAPGAQCGRVYLPRTADRGTATIGGKNFHKLTCYNGGNGAVRVAHLKSLSVCEGRLHG